MGSTEKASPCQPRTFTAKSGYVSFLRRFDLQNCFSIQNILIVKLINMCVKKIFMSSPYCCSSAIHNSSHASDWNNG